MQPKPRIPSFLWLIRCPPLEAATPSPRPALPLIIITKHNMQYLAERPTNPNLLGLEGDVQARIASMFLAQVFGNPLRGRRI